MLISVPLGVLLGISLIFLREVFFSKYAFEGIDIGIISSFDVRDRGWKYAFSEIIPRLKHLVRLN